MLKSYTKKGNEKIAPKVVANVVIENESISFNFSYAIIFESMQPKAANITSNFANISIELVFKILFNELILNIKKTPIKPIIIDISFIKENFSFFVKKWDITNVIIGPIAMSMPAVEEGINCSAQLIKQNGIKLPIIPIIINKNITCFVKIISFFCI